MNRISICFFLVVYWATFATAEKEAPKLITLKKDYSLNNLANAEVSLKKALEEISYKPMKDSLVFFIHGRGNHPKKARKERIPQMEQQYGIKVLTFHWPSWEGPLSYPDKAAQKAALQLKWLLLSLQKYKQNQAREISVTLFIHSMGNIVFQTLIKSHSEGLQAGLFSNIILNASDVALKNHKTWVDQILLHKQLYITFNNHDIILGMSGTSLGSARLGKKLKTWMGKEEPLSNKAIYIDFSNTRVNHKYYLTSGQNNNIHIHKFYQMIFYSQKVNLTPENGFIEVKPLQIYRVL